MDNLNSRILLSNFTLSQKIFSRLGLYVLLIGGVVLWYVTNFLVPLDLYLSFPVLFAVVNWVLYCLGAYYPTYVIVGIGRHGDDSTLLPIFLVIFTLLLAVFELTLVREISNKSPGKGLLWNILTLHTISLIASVATTAVFFVWVMSVG